MLFLSSPFRVLYTSKARKKEPQKSVPAASLSALLLVTVALSLTVLVSSRPEFHFIENWTQGATTSPGTGRAGGGQMKNPPEAPQRCHVLQGGRSQDVRLNFNLEKSSF